MLAQNLTQLYPDISCWIILLPNIRQISFTGKGEKLRNKLDTELNTVFDTELDTVPDTDIYTEFYTELDIQIDTEHEHFTHM